MDGEYFVKTNSDTLEVCHTIEWSEETKLNIPILSEVLCYYYQIARMISE